MSICNILQNRMVATSGNTFFYCLLVSLTLTPPLRADDDSGKASNMLNVLKQRSAAERWQRVKRQYPVEAPAPHRNIPSPLPQEQQRALPDEELPPSPTEEYAIPRLTSLPTDDSSDWIRPARPVFLEEESESPSRPSNVPRLANARAALAEPDYDPPVDRRGTTKVEDDNEEHDDKKKDDAKDKFAGGSARTPIERQIGSIKPYYDRDEDKDIRKFAKEKGKEFNINFQPKPYEERSFPEICMAWEPTNFYYYPLYFADPALERYGHAHHPLIQPFASIGRAGAQFVLLPYQMAIIPPCKQEYPLGYHRPGDCVEKLHYQIPLNAQAALVEGAVITGLYFVIP